MKELWFKKYRPKTIDDYIFADENQKAIIKAFIEEKSIPHLILYGHRGTGKSSLAYLLKNALGIEDSDFQEFNASHDTSIEVVRNKIIPFSTTMPMGDFRIVFLDEADRLSPAAQDALKKQTEDFSHNARFIFVTNKINKISGELRSRCQEMEFASLNKTDVLEKAYRILRNEKIKTSLETLEKYVDASYPDFRKLLNLLEGNSKDGMLKDEFDVKDSMFEVKAECMMHVESGDWNTARKLLAEQFDDDDYEDAYKFFYDNLNELDKFKDVNMFKAGIVIIAEYLYRNQFVADKEILFCAMMMKLSEI